MFSSLKKIKSLPQDTRIYFGHEYTKRNIEFCLSIEPNNVFLKDQLIQLKKKLKNNYFSSPTTLQEEIKGNVFLKANNLNEFKKYRDLKDSF